MIIIGIDPGTDRAGYGVIRKTGQSCEFIEAGVLKTGKQKGAAVLCAIKKDVDRLILKYSPEILATEKLFFTKNQTTGIQIAEARGVILLAAGEKNIPVREFTPNEIKLSVTGYGNADKKAILKMVKLILKQPDLKMLDDASDALAIAITAAGRFST